MTNENKLWLEEQAAVIKMVAQEIMENNGRGEWNWGFLWVTFGQKNKPGLKMIACSGCPKNWSEVENELIKTFPCIRLSWVNMD